MWTEPFLLQGRPLPPTPLHTRCGFATRSELRTLLRQIDMQEYQDIVGDSLALTSVGGSDACKATVVNGHAVIADMIKSEEGRQSLAELFNFCQPSEALQSEEEAGMWAAEGVIYVPSQENDPACSTPACDIGSICTMLEEAEGDDDVTKLAAVSGDSKERANRRAWGWVRRTKRKNQGPD